MLFITANNILEFVMLFPVRWSLVKELISLYKIELHPGMDMLTFGLLAMGYVIWAMVVPLETHLGKLVYVGSTVSYDGAALAMSQVKHFGTLKL